MLNFLLLVVIALLPVVNVNGVKTPSFLFYSALFLALVLMARHRIAGAGEVTVRYRPVIASYGVLLLAGMISALVHLAWSGSDMEGAIRFFVGLWLFLIAFSYLPRAGMRQVLWGVYASVLISFVIVLYLSWPDFVRPETPYHNAVTYGNLLLLLGVLSLFSIPWQLTQWQQAEKLFKIGVGALAFIGFILTQTRTGWLALPVFVYLGVVLFYGARRPWRTIIVSLVLIVIAALVFVSNANLRERAVEAYTEAASCQGEGSVAPTSICIRLQLWRSTVDMYKQNPLVGIGDGRRFPELLETDSYSKGLVSKETLDMYFGEPHNDVLFMLVVFGPLAALGLLLIYFVPAVYFLRRLYASPTPQARAAAAMGAAVCLGFAIYGLTELMFRRMHVTGFYTVLVAFFLVLSEPQVADENRQSVESY